jgi:hypothetical protein
MSKKVHEVYDLRDPVWSEALNLFNEFFLLHGLQVISQRALKYKPLQTKAQSFCHALLGGLVDLPLLFFIS